ncbi:MAG: TATA-box-binding protein [Nanoarchaeota archaeon]|nr:TATA-box-binding protein [Nanoarchaeota archaeon]
MNGVKVQNIVASVNLFASLINLEKLAKNLDNVTYDPSRFPGACLKLKDPKVSILIFTSGKIVVSGSKTEEDMHSAIKKVKKKLRKLGVRFKKSYDAKIQNVVASGDVGFKINLNKLAFKAEDTEYNPEQFPGLVHKPSGSNLSFLLFNTGKIVCTGAKSKKEIVNGRRKLVAYLKSLGFHK